MIKILLYIVIVINAVFPFRLYAVEELGTSSFAETTIKIDISKVRANFTGPKNPVARERVPEFVSNRCVKESISMCMPGGKGDSFKIKVDPPSSQGSFSAKDKNGKSHPFSVGVITNQENAKNGEQKNKNEIDNGLVELEDSKCAADKMPKITLNYKNNSCDFVNEKLHGKMNVRIIPE
ncbi:MAG: hypothetical protein ACI85N_001986 [Gammaproteobacteria bacterium]